MKSNLFCYDIDKKACHLADMMGGKLLLVTNTRDLKAPLQVTDQIKKMMSYKTIMRTCEFGEALEVVCNSSSCKTTRGNWGIGSSRIYNERSFLPGGLAIMCAVFSGLGIEQMNNADGALRLGVLYDLLGRFHHHDMRDSTVQQFMRRYQVDLRQAGRVEKTALSLLGQLT